jgi:tetratricopeptide (TPR) repeat protein
MEYADARAAFQRATESDPERWLGHAWLSRTALLMGDLRAAEAAARTASQLVTTAGSKGAPHFAGAVLAESQRDLDRAEREYRNLAELFPDDPVMRAELADFLKRQSRNGAAVEAYHEALQLDAGYVRPHVDLCQLYSSMDDYPRSEQHAGIALKEFRAIGNRGGEAQALLCYGDSLLQQGNRLKEARQQIKAARDIFTELQYEYGLARVYQYLGFVEGREHNFAAAATAFEESLRRSRQIGNRSLEGLELMNLGVAHEAIGHVAQAVSFYQQSRDVYQQIGDERRAAEQAVNAARFQVDYGLDTEDALRRLAMARATFRKLRYLDFEIVVMEVQAKSEAYAGRFGEAQRLLHEATSLATERALKGRQASLKVTTAMVEFLLGNYETARTILEEAVTSGGATPEAQVALARVYVMLGDFATAKNHLDAAFERIQTSGAMTVAPLAYLTLGELSDESGVAAGARAHFLKAVEAADQALPDAAAVEARCHLAALGSGDMKAALSHAGRMRHLHVQVKCRLDQARLEFGQRRYAEALESLEGIPAGSVTLGPELQAQVHFWRSRALAARGDKAAAELQAAAARKIVTQVQGALPERYRDRFASRVSIRPLIQ